MPAMAEAQAVELKISDAKDSRATLPLKTLQMQPWEDINDDENITLELIRLIGNDAPETGHGEYYSLSRREQYRT